MVETVVVMVLVVVKMVATSLCALPARWPAGSSPGILAVTISGGIEGELSSAATAAGAL
jgi:hypothetical protein